MTARLAPVDPSHAHGKAADLLGAVQRKLGMTPNMVRTMAQSPAVLEAYLSFNGALANGTFNARSREQLALAIAEVNDCGYCASAHTAFGKVAGLTTQQAAEALHGRGMDARTSAAIELARQIIERRGAVSDDELGAARAAGLSDPEIAEVVAHVALNVFTNYFNRLAQTEIDFPVVGTGMAPVS